MLRSTNESRSLKDNLMLASSSAFAAGAVNVVGLIAFFAFSSNVTGHVANLAKNIADLDKDDIISLTVWLCSFFMGAFLASYLIQSLKKYSTYRAHATPILIEIVILLAIAVYGNRFYTGHQTASQVVVAALLFSMGLQNATVSHISGGMIKTSHLTGLMTDLGTEVAYYWHPETPKPEPVRNKILIRVTILSLYIFGGLVGAFCFYEFGFKMFFGIPVILVTILLYDQQSLMVHRTRKFFRNGN